MSRLYRQQSGAVMIVALIMLAILTLVAVGSMRSSDMQEKMASNTQQKVLSHYAAEFAVKAAEKWLGENMSSSGDLEDFIGKDGLYAQLPRGLGLPAAPLASNIALNNREAWDALGIEVEGLSEQVTIRPSKYIIECIGRGQISASATQVNQLNADMGQTDISPYFFRITAIGWSRDEKIHSILEAVYRTGFGDGVFTYY